MTVIVKMMIMTLINIYRNNSSTIIAGAELKEAVEETKGGVEKEGGGIRIGKLRKTGETTFVFVYVYAHILVFDLLSYRFMFC